MPKIQLQNVGTIPIIIRDPSGYTDFVAEVPPNSTVTAVISANTLGYIAPLLNTMEGENPSNSLIKLRWAVLASEDVDDRAEEEGLAGLASLTELQLSAYNTTGGDADAVAVGTNLLGGQTKAALQVLIGTARLDLEAVVPGSAGNAISCEVIAPSATLDISVGGNKITIRPATGGSTVADIVSAINLSATARLLVQAVEGVAGTFNAALAEQTLTGGRGAGVSLTLSGVACLITELTNTQITFDIPSGISTSTYIVPLDYRNGPHVSRLSVPVIAP